MSLSETRLSEADLANFMKQFGSLKDSFNV